MNKAKEIGLILFASVLWSFIEFVIFFRSPDNLTAQVLFLLLALLVVEIYICDCFGKFNLSILVLILVIALFSIVYVGIFNYLLWMSFGLVILLKIKSFLVCRRII